MEENEGGLTLQIKLQNIRIKKTERCHDYEMTTKTYINTVYPSINTNLSVP